MLPRPWCVVYTAPVTPRPGAGTHEAAAPDTEVSTDHGDGVPPCPLGALPRPPQLRPGLRLLLARLLRLLGPAPPRPRPRLHLLLPLTLRV